MEDDRFIFLYTLPHRHKPTQKISLSSFFDYCYIIIFGPITILYSYYLYYVGILTAEPWSE